MLSRGKALLLGVAIAAAVYLLCRVADLPGPAAWTAAITALCAAWWVMEPIPIPATSILPFALFPFAGVLTDRQVATAYGHPMVLLLMGGFLLSTAMEKNHAHRRVAQVMLRLTGGGSQRRVVLGFMLATAVCSMWISNTATALMMLPVVLAVLEQPDTDRLRIPLLLGVAYAASIGGLGTPIGTPPNVIFVAVYREITGVQMGFTSWMLIGVPAVLLLLPAAWLRLSWRLKGGRVPVIPSLGPWTQPERRVLIMFGITALAWMTRTEPAGGWSGLFDLPGVGDSTVALLAVALMFLVPNGKGEPLLDWRTARRIPWGLLLLFGGGIAIARAFSESGLSEALGSAMTGIAVLPLALTLFLLCLCVTFLTEVTSNTATTTLLLPILGAAAVAVEVDPMLYMVPATLSASCAFMLPVATAPNAVVFGTELFPLRRMAREGFVLNLVGAVLLTGWCLWILPRVAGD